MRALSRLLRLIGFFMIGVFLGYSIYDIGFNPAYQYGSAPLWVYIAWRFFSCGLVAAGCFFLARLLDGIASRRGQPDDGVK